MLRAWNGYLDVFATASMSVEEVIDAGDEVVAVVRVSGISKRADVPFEHVWVYVCRVRDGKLVYQRPTGTPTKGSQRPASPPRSANRGTGGSGASR